jgi:hypothetical protein
MPDPTKVEYASVGGVSLAVIALGTLLRFQNLPPTPRIAGPPATPAHSVQTSLRFSEAYHRAQIEKDSQQYGVVFDYPNVTEPFPYAVELTTPKSLSPKKEGLQTAHLELQATMQQEWAGGLKTDHLFLKIKNRSRNFIAYRVDTTVPDLKRCKDAAQLAHNAIVLRPGEEIVRSECLYRPGDVLVVKKVEIVDIPPISYHYLARLYPPHILMDPRIGASHEVAGVKRCGLIPWQEIRDAADAKEADWADVIDFYGRHVCEEYTFFRGYRRATAVRKLPAIPPKQ